MSRAVQWKVKLQRMAGYLGLGTFAIVLYQLLRDLYASPYVPWKPENFYIFFAAVVLLAGGVLIALAEFDWRFIFPREIGVQHLKDPMFFATAFLDANILRTFSRGSVTYKNVEARLRVMYRSVGREPEWDEALRLLGLMKGEA